MPELGEVGEQIASLSRADVVAELRRQWQSRKTGQGGCTGAASLGGAAPQPPAAGPAATGTAKPSAARKKRAPEPPPVPPTGAVKCSFPKAPRWQEPSKPDPSPPPPSQQRPLDLTAGYNMILPRVAAPQFSATPRFQDAEQRERSTSPTSSDITQEPDKGQVPEQDVPAAIDFVKRRHVPTVTFAPPAAPCTPRLPLNHLQQQHSSPNKEQQQRQDGEQQRKETLAPPVLEPSWDLVLRRAPSTVFMRASASLRRDSMRESAFGHIWTSTEPGPGAYHREELESYSSRHRRAPAAVISSASLDLTSSRQQSPPRPLLELDAAAAVDRIKPRASTVVFSTAGLHSRHTYTCDNDDDYQERPLLEISYSLVEPSSRTAVVMKQPLAESLAALSRKSEDESSQITWDEGTDPWQIDMAIRIRHPAWSMAGRPVPPKEQLQLLHLNPSYNLVELRVTGVPVYMPLMAHSRSPARPMPWTALDLETAWRCLAAHVPGGVWKAPVKTIRSGTSTVQPEQEEDERPPLEVAAALDWLRPRAASAVFNPLPTSHRRLENFMAAGVMSLLNVAHALDLVKPSAPRPVPFQKQLARPDPALSQDASTATAHQQELTINWSAVEPVVRVRHFSKYLGHDIFTEEEEEAGSRHGSPEKPEGAVLELDVVRAKDATLRNPPRPVAEMSKMLGREDLVAPSLTAGIGLPDPDLDLVSSTRPRTVSVTLKGPGRGLDDPPSPDTAKRGPGMFGIPEQRSPGPAWDFGRAQGRPDPDSEAPGAQTDGSRLILEPNDAVLHPRVTSALILPEHKPVPLHKKDGQEQQPGSPGQEAAPLPDLDAVRPLQPRPIPFDKQLGRPELHPNSSPQPTSDYKDVPLTVLAGNRRVLGVLKFGKGNTQPPAQVAEVADGDRLDLSTDAAFKATQARHHPVPALAKQLGREDVKQGQEDLTEWVAYKYNPRDSLIKPTQATHIVPWAASPDTHKKDQDDFGRMYDVKWQEVDPEPRATKFSASAVARLQPLSPGGGGQQGGDALWLDPQPVAGYRRPKENRRRMYPERFPSQAVQQPALYLHPDGVQ